MMKLRKYLSRFRSPAMSGIIQWEKCIRGRMILICILNIVLPLCSLGVVLVTKELVDSAVSHGSEALLQYGVLLVLLILTQQAFGILEDWIVLHTNTRLQREMQGMFAGTLLRKEYPSLKGIHSGEMVSRFFSDVSTVKSGIMDILPSVLCSLVGFIGSVTILVSIDWRLILVLVVGGLIGFGTLAFFREPVKRRHRQRREAEEKLHISVQEAFEGIRLIKASQSEKRVLSKVWNDQEQLEKTQLDQGRFSMIMHRSMGLALSFSWLFCMVWGCISIFRGRMSYGELAAIIQLINRVEDPFVEAFSLAGQVFGTISSAERIQQLTELPEEVQGESVTDFDEICLDQLCFSYEDGNDDVLTDVSFTIRKGDFTAVTGISGGGKTSLFQLMLGLYPPNSGRILIRNGSKAVPVSGGTRNLFAYVPQGNTLFSGTLRDNLLMFADNASDSDIESAVRNACIDELVKEVGLDAVLGEHGVGLSEGQAQRIAIARALLCDAPVLLLDEATSALDEGTEARLLKKLAAMPGKTCLIVTHRRAALAICNRRLHLEGGRPVPEADIGRMKEI